MTRGHNRHKANRNQFRANFPGHPLTEQETMKLKYRMLFIEALARQAAASNPMSTAVGEVAPLTT